jgi:hypothetical protein
MATKTTMGDKVTKVMMVTKAPMVTLG